MLQHYSSLYHKLVLIISVFVVSMYATITVYAWTEPTVAPPGGNVAGLLNVQGTTQTKTGGLNIMGNVGIGTTSPTTLLDLYKSGTAVEMLRLDNPLGGPDLSSKLTFYQGSNENGYIDSHYTPTTGWALRFGTRNAGTTAADRMIIDKDGNVGIGTSAPGQRLHVVGDASAPAGVTAIRLETTSTGSGQFAGIQMKHGNSANLWQTLALSDGSLVLAGLSGSPAAMTVLGSGNVGIGTTSPSEALHVQGAILGSRTDIYGDLALQRIDATPTAGDTLSIIGMQGPDSGGTQTEYAEIIGYSTAITDGAESGAIAFSTRNVGSFGERVRIAANGNVGIGTTSPTSKLQVVSASNDDYILMKSTGGASNFVVDATTGMPARYLFRENGTNKFNLEYASAGYDLHYVDSLQLRATGISAPLVTFATSGNVGIGTTTPTFAVHAVGTVDPVSMTVDSVGSVVASNFMGRRARGTIDSPSAVQQNDKLVALNGRGYGSTGYSTSARGLVDINAAENWTDSAQGTYINFWTTSASSTTIAERMRITANGNVGIGMTTPQSTLHVPDGKYLQAEDNNAGAPPSADCDNDAERGRISIDTTNNRLYVCNGATRGWDYAALTD